MGCRGDCRHGNRGMWGFVNIESAVGSESKCDGGHHRLSVRHPDGCCRHHGEHLRDNASFVLVTVLLTRDTHHDTADGSSRRAEDLPCCLAFA
jgi:hypothetical protein